MEGSTCAVIKGVLLGTTGGSDFIEGLHKIYLGVTGQGEKEGINIRNGLFHGDSASYDQAKITLGLSSLISLFQITPGLNTGSQSTANSTTGNGDVIDTEPVVGAENAAIGEDLNHVFGKPEHNLNGFLDSYGGNQNSAFNAVQNMAQNTINSNTYATGSDFILNVNGYSITVRGAFVNGKFRIGTFFIP